MGAGLVSGLIGVAGVAGAPFTGGTSLALTLSQVAGQAMSFAQQSGLSFGNGLNQQAKAYGAEITNHIEGGLDLNRLAFISGLISVHDLERNYQVLWQTLHTAASRVREAGTSGAMEYAQRMISDRDYGGQFAHEWRGIMYDDLLERWFPPEKLDYAGYVLPEWQEAWPEKSRYMDTGVPTPEEVPGFTIEPPPPGTTAGERKIAGIATPKVLGLLGLTVAGVVGFLWWRS